MIVHKPRRTRQRKKAMIAALNKTLGIVCDAANIVGINKDTHYDWIRTDPDYARAVESIDDVVLDFAESQLHKQIQEGNTIATIFFLKTKGKKRGYIERTEVDNRILSQQHTTIKIIRDGDDNTET